MLFDRNKNKGFTLAEALLVIGIIGVVAMLALPNFNQTTGNLETVTKVKKAYNVLNEAFSRAVATYGPYSGWFASDTTENARNLRFANRMVDFLKLSKNCQNTSADCSPYALNTANYRVIFNDGSSVLFNARHMWFDVNGSFNGGNVDGIDGGFGFDVSADGESIVPRVANPALTSPTRSYSEWVIKVGNMDYLKLTDGKCPNGNTLGWATGNVKSCL